MQIRSILVKLNVVFAIFVSVSCKKTTASDILLEETLKYAGENRTELDKVLKHYDKHTDSLKYKAAHFLVENMLGHRSDYNTSIKNTKHIEALEILNNRASKIQPKATGNHVIGKAWWAENRKVKHEISALLKAIDSDKHTVKNDIKIIKSKWLITHIDKAFENWEASKTYNNIDFNEFSETLLPYRYGKEQLNVPEAYPKKIWKPVLANVNLKNTKTIVRALTKYFANVNKLTRQLDYKNDLGFYNILKWTKLNCYDQTAIAAKILNDIGVPTYIEHTPMRFESNAPHSWCVVKDSLGNLLPFSPWWQTLDPLEDNTLHRKNYFERVTKVYRINYAFQDEFARKYKQADEVVYPFFDTVYENDVTDRYHETTTLRIPIHASDFKQNNLAYLSVFTSNRWAAIGWGRVNESKTFVEFKKVPKGCVYAITKYTGEKLQPVTPLFYVNIHGEKIDIAPKDTNIDTMALNKKFPDKERIIYARQILKGARFEGANNIEFKNADTLYEFDEAPKNYVEALSILSAKTYRYVRFIPKAKAEAHMAIIEYYTLPAKTASKKGIETMPYISRFEDTLHLNLYKKQSKLTGKLISNNKNAPLERLQRTVDGNMETFATDKWVGVDFGTPKKITSIRYAGRNANNRINVGDTYELLYYDEGWKTHAKQRAVYNFLNFSQVPSGTIYWLRNLTKGKEEMAFIYKDGKQLFVNYDNLETYFE